MGYSKIPRRLLYYTETSPTDESSTGKKVTGDRTSTLVTVRNRGWERRMSPTGLEVPRNQTERDPPDIPGLTLCVRLLGQLKSPSIRQ